MNLSFDCIPASMVWKMVCFEVGYDSEERAINNQGRCHVPNLNACTVHEMT